MTNFETDIVNCIKILNEGGIILYPTDTVWGIGCDATNATAVDKIIALKKRADNKSFIVLMASEKDINKYVATLNPIVFEYLNAVQNPTTVIYESAIGLAENLLAADGSVAIRIVQDEFCRHLIKRFKKPIVSTSANISNTPTPLIFEEINSTIKNGVDYIVQHRSKDLVKALPSSIIKFDKEGNIIVIRK